MHEFDKPLFKQLAPNDTPETGANQAGFLLPREFEPYFPKLEKPSAENPTPEIMLRAALFDGESAMGIEDVRYHYQTRGLTRAPEPRITRNLGAIRKLSWGGDLLVIERSLTDGLFFRLTLHRRGTDGYAKLKPAIGVREFGPLDPMDPPVSEDEIAAHENEIAESEKVPLQLFDNNAEIHENRVKKVARSKAFSKHLLPMYDYKCAVCGHGHVAENTWEAEAAHIVPRGLKGADDARNGLVLCRSHHWAFDQGLFGIRPDFTIELRPDAAANDRNGHLLLFNGKQITVPQAPDPQPSREALAWHFKHIAQLD